MSASVSPRPPLKSQQSTSLPSTPNYCPRDRGSHSRSPSAKRNASNPSPRSHHSDSLPPLRKSTAGCKYETGMANAKRRVPYSLGPDKLDADSEVPKASLTPAEEGRLTADMRELYGRLLPSPESEDRRKKLVGKLEAILRKQWPGRAIKVNVFGSTGNKLGTSDSDVDICITTDCRELEQVCVLADFLAKQGMQRVVCVSEAKVPIVKIWDADLRLACDMNVNNPVALENTEMIRAYVEIDQRVRPLAMIIKHWTKRRVLNEAALGGTLSSYTWICMIINFLQTRDPPILPALQQECSRQTKIMSGLDVSYDKNIASYQGYGSRNKSSLGVLLFQFFRYYGHEIDFETSVMSVRAGKVITKSEKNWHFLQDNRLCVEEPFNTSRNLGNTADDTSVRGIHLELRRAFKMISQCDLAKCCTEYEPPANFVDETRPLERHNISVSQPTLAHPTATSGRFGRGGSRGGRHNNQSHRSSNAGRRLSSASTRAHAFSQPLPLGANVTPTDLSLQAQQQQYLLHDRLFQQYQFLQAQEHELRAQLHQQAVLQGRVMPTSTYPYFLLPYGPYQGGQGEFVRAKAGSVTQPPLTAPIRPHGFSFPSSSGARIPTFESTTSPSSPLLHTAVPDARRTYRRSSFTNGSSAGSLRAQSQPPRPVPSPLSFPGGVDRHSDHGRELPHNSDSIHAPAPGSCQEIADALTAAQERLHQNRNTYQRGSEYIGYYLGHSPPLPMYSRSVISSPSNSNTGLGIQNCGISPQMLAQLPPNPLGIPPLPSESSQAPRSEKEVTKFESADSLPFVEARDRSIPLSRSSSGPVVVHGSVHPETKLHQSNVDLDGSLNVTNFDASASDDIAVETPTSSDGSSQGMLESQILENGNSSTVAPHVIASEVSKKQKGPKKATRSLNSPIDSPATDRDSKPLPGSRSLENQPLRVNGSRPAREVAVAPHAELSRSDGNELQSQALRLSPVKEVRTPSPTQRRQSSLAEESVQEPSKSKMKTKTKAQKSSLSFVDPSDDKSEALAAQPNGLSSSRAFKFSSNMGAVGGWQTQKKKSRHKKGSKSETDVKGGNSIGGEFWPLDESLRKGG